MVQIAKAHDRGGGGGGGVMEPGGIVRWSVSVGQHVPLLVSLLFCQPLATQAVAKKKDLYYPHGTSTAIENPTYKQVTPGYSTTQSSDPG